MKKTVLILSVLIISISAQSSDWIIHGAFGTNPWVGFAKCENGSVSMMQRMYGVATDWNSNFDGWVDPAACEVATNGEVLVISGDWTPSAITCEDYSSCSSHNWFIEDGWPNFNGGSSQDMEGTIPGEYWIDWSPTGVIRIESSRPLDFGKWMSDGSINPYYTEPILLKGKGRSKKH